MAEDFLYMKCPRFDHCSVQVCPLDADADRRIHLPGEPKCTCPKSIRVRLGKDLPLKGLTQKEFSAQKYWENLPESKRTTRRLAAKEMLLKQGRNHEKTHIKGV
jgi:hypothetical protein